MSERKIRTTCDVVEKISRRERAEGRAEAIFKLVDKNIISPRQGAKELKMSSSKFAQAFEAWRAE